MKRVLFLRSLTDKELATNKDWARLTLELSEFMQGEVQVEAAPMSSLAFLVDGRSSRVWHPQLGWDVADFDLVIFRRVGNELEKATSIAHYLNSKRVPFIDQYILRPGKGKLSGAFLRAGNGIPVPRTFCGTIEIYKRLFQDKPLLSYPFVLKADNGRKGLDNYLVYNYNELLSVLNKSKHLDMIAQEFIPNDGDLRVLMLNGIPRLVIERKGKAGSHLNNTSRGGTATLLPVSVLSSQVQSDCKRAVQLEELQVAGVDIIVNKINGRHYFLEVNRAPQITTGAFTDEKLNAYTTMVEELVEESARSKSLQAIGRVENVQIKDFTTIPARIDTGAKTSAIWASNIYEKDGILHFTLFDKESGYYTGDEISTADFHKRIVASSNGEEEERWVVKLLFGLKGRKIRASFTLANRSKQTYPVLVGRNVLRGKFVVDVKQGQPLKEAEKLRSQQLQKRLSKE